MPNQSSGDNSRSCQEVIRVCFTQASKQFGFASFSIHRQMSRKLLVVDDENKQDRLLQRSLQRRVIPLWGDSRQAPQRAVRFQSALRFRIGFLHTVPFQQYARHLRSPPATRKELRFLRRAFANFPIGTERSQLLGMGPPWSH